MPQLTVIKLISRAKVDRDHAADAVIIRSRTEFIVYTDYDPTFCVSKK